MMLADYCFELSGLKFAGGMRFSHFYSVAVRQRPLGEDTGIDC